MKKACIVVSRPYMENKLFDLGDSNINRDNCMYPLFFLKKKFKEKGYDLSTQDINTIKESSIVIYNEMPKILPNISNAQKSYLLIFESELIKPNNWDLNRHQYFNKVFTWNDDYVDNKKYFKINFSQDIPKKINKDLLKKEKLCTLIAGNKKSNRPKELYSKRVEAIRWFEKNYSQDFDLYGIGWDKYSSSNKYINYALSKTPFLKKIFAKKYPSYKGIINKKKEILEKYKFAICYENAVNISGYITEKIFDCFFAGCVPIYWGANNISEYIPSDCFIDKRKFDNYKNLYKFVKNMREKRYMEYLDNIGVFLNSDDSYQFTSEYFVETIVRNINE